MNPWQQVKDELATKVSPETFQNWLARTEFLAFTANGFSVLVPDDVTKAWLQEEAVSDVWAAIHHLGLPFRHVVYEISSSSHTNSFDESDQVFGPTIRLNPKYVFENFVVGSCNQFAHAAARAVGIAPAKSYNPLFIYGGVGIGKTHLINAIGSLLHTQHPGMRIVYTSSERFMNEMVNCIKLDRMQMFKRHYRSADVLLIDDVQILAGKEAMQEEFFHTFNELFEHQKQIVLSSDSPPKHTPGLVERLRSRFEWGLMVDMLPPDLETKLAILAKKAEMMDVHLPEDVRVFIATKTKSNVRELEGALVQLAACSSVTSTKINMDMAQQVLKHFGQSTEKKIPMEAIMKAVAEVFHLQSSQLKQKSNEQKIAYPRQIAMFLAKELTSASLPEIGRAFGGKHHTTVLHSINKIDKLRQTNPDLNNLIYKLVDSIH